VHLAAGHDQMTVGRGDVDPTGQQQLTVGGDGHRQVGDAIEDRRQQAAARGGDVQDDADRRRQVGGKVADEPDQRVHATSGGADADHARGAGALGRILDHIPSLRPFGRLRDHSPGGDSATVR